MISVALSGALSSGSGKLELGWPEHLSRSGVSVRCDKCHLTFYDPGRASAYLSSKFELT